MKPFRIRILAFQLFRFLRSLGVGGSVLAFCMAASQASDPTPFYNQKFKARTAESAKSLIEHLQSRVEAINGKLTNATIEGATLTAPVLGASDNISFIATGSTESRSVANRAADIVNAADFATLQAAADRLTADSNHTGIYSGELFIPPGIYDVYSTILISNSIPTALYGLTIRGSGVGATWIRTHGCDGFKFANGQNLVVRDLLIGPSSGTTNNSGIVIQREIHPTIERCQFTGLTNAIEVVGDGGVNNSHSLTVRNCQFANCTIGIRSDYVALNASMIGPCNEIASCALGISLSGSSIAVTRNTIEACGSGINVTGLASALDGNSYTINHNYFEGITTNCIQWGSTGALLDGMTIEGNYFLSSGSGNFVKALAGAIKGLVIDKNTVTPGTETALIDLASCTLVSGNQSSYRVHRITSPNTYPGIRLSTLSSDSFARDWGVYADVNTYGDFALIQSTAKGGDPSTVGTNRLYGSASGQIQVPDLAVVTATITNLTGTTTAAILNASTQTVTTLNATNVSVWADATGTYVGATLKTASLATGARNWGVYANALTFGDIAIVQSTALGGDPKVAGTNRLYATSAGQIQIPDLAVVTASITNLTGTTTAATINVTTETAATLAATNSTVWAPATGTFSGQYYKTASANAAARNWWVGANVSAFGDFAIRQSTALGGDPVAAGVTKFSLDANGRAQIVATSITNIALAAGRAMVSGANQEETTSATTATQIGYLSTLTGDVQVQIDAKTPSTRTISTTAPITGGGDLSANRTLAMAASTDSVDGYMTAADHTILTGKLSKSIWTTKGDILSATATATPARLAVGTDGQTLIADSASAGGLKWTNQPTGGSTPTGTGFPHITSGTQDGSARAVNLSTSDVTGILPRANIARVPVVQTAAGSITLSSADQVLWLLGGGVPCLVSLPSDMVDSNQQITVLNQAGGFTCSIQTTNISESFVNGPTGTGSTNITIADGKSYTIKKMSASQWAVISQY